MNWMAAYEQKEDALLRVFYMLLASFLLTIRAGLGPRAAYVLLPVEGASHSDTSAAGTQPPPTPDADFRYRALMLLCAIEGVRQQLAALMMRALYELMNQAHTLAMSGRQQASDSANPCELPGKRLDSS